MKTPFATVLFVVLALSFTACGPALRYVKRPESYSEAMEQLADEIQRLDKHLIGEQYEPGTFEARRIVELSRRLASFDPLRVGDGDNEFQEYYSQCDDMARKGDWLVYAIEQRRKDDARDALIELAARYNKLTRRFGPGFEVEVFDPRATLEKK